MRRPQHSVRGWQRVLAIQHAVFAGLWKRLGQMGWRVVHLLCDAARFLKRITPRIVSVVSREVLEPGLCILSTGSGVLSSTSLLTAKVLPSVFAVIPDNLDITPKLGVALTALVVVIHSYHHVRQSRNSPWLIRLLRCYCDGLIWPFWISVPLVHRLNSFRRRIMRKKDVIAQSNPVGDKTKGSDNTD